jgi:hypothetical protein
MIIERGKGESAFDVATSPLITLSIMIVWLNVAESKVCKIVGELFAEERRRVVDSDPIRRLMVGPLVRVMPHPAILAVVGRRDGDCV